MEWFLLLVLVVGIGAWAARRQSSDPPAADERQERAVAAKPRRQAELPNAEIEFASSQFSLICFVQPKATHPVGVRESSTSSALVFADLQAQTCTCPAFVARAGKPTNQFGRWCRHLVYALREDGAFDDANEWHQAMAASGFEGPTGALHIARTSAPDVVIARGDSDEWVNVYARTKRSGERIAEASGPIARYSWSLVERRWAYGEAPPGARELRRMLKIVVGIDVIDP